MKRVHVYVLGFLMILTSFIIFAFSFDFIVFLGLDLLFGGIMFLCIVMFKLNKTSEKKEKVK